MSASDEPSSVERQVSSAVARRLEAESELSYHSSVVKVCIMSKQRGFSSVG